MTETTTDQAGGMVLSRARLSAMALGLAVTIAAVVSMAVSSHHDWRAYVAYWGAPMMPLPATAAARTWFLVSMLGVLVGVAVVLVAAIPRRAAAAAVAGATIAAVLVLVLTALS